MTKKIVPQPATQPEFQRVTVTPGSLNKLFRFLGMSDGVLNRPIRADRVRAMGRHWKADEAAGSYLVLWDRGDHYSIIDGQHRITAISEYLGESVELGAIVYPPSYFVGGADTLLSALDGQYNAVGQKNSDRIRARAAMSAWPQIFKEYGLELAFDTSRSRITWDGLLAARLRADVSHKQKRVIGLARLAKGVSERAAIVGAWEHYTEADIRQTAETLQWWKPIAEQVYQSRKASALSSSAGLQFALLLRECNPHGLGAVSGFEAKVMSSGQGVHHPPAVSAAGSNHPRAVIAHLLGIANYRRSQEHRASIYDIRADIES